MSEFKYHILCLHQASTGWVHCDYAKDEKDRDYLLGKYRMTYGPGFRFQVRPYKEKAE